jgi:hypothetical protein
MGIKTRVADQLDSAIGFRIDMLTLESWQSVCAAMVAASVLLRAAEEREIQSFGEPYEVCSSPGAVSRG